MFYEWNNSSVMQWGFRFFPFYSVILIPKASKEKKALLYSAIPPRPCPWTFSKVVLVLFEGTVTCNKFYKNLNLLICDRSSYMKQFHNISIWCPQSWTDPPHKVNFRFSENEIYWSQLNLSSEETYSLLGKLI